MVSICIPASTIDYSRSRSQRQASNVAHQIARACIQYKVTEIVVYEHQIVQAAPLEQDAGPKKIIFNDTEAVDDADSPIEPSAELAQRLQTLLSFFVCPTYLRAIMFSSAEIEYAKKMPKLPALPFVNQSSKFAEGFTVPSKEFRVVKKKGQLKSKKELARESTTNLVCIGRDTVLKLSEKTTVMKRVTVDVKNKAVVPASKAYGQDHSYFGYSVRTVHDFSELFTQSTIDGGYTETVYVNCNEFATSSDLALPLTVSLSDKAVLVFGAWSEVQAAVKADKSLPDDAATIFDGQVAGPKNMRVEDRVLITLDRLALAVAV